MCTFVLAQRTPLNAAFWTIGLDRTLEDRRIELLKRSEVAMVSLNAIGMENRGGCGLEAVLLVEAQEREELLELSLETPKLLGETRNIHNFCAQPKAEKATQQI
jgi:hypothetical protein